MAYCEITSITNPTSTSSFQVGSTVNVTWTNTGSGCNDWNVSQIDLQSNQPSGWNTVSTVFLGIDGVTSNSKSITLPSSVSAYGDYYRLKVIYTQEDEEF